MTKNNNLSHIFTFLLITSLCLSMGFGCYIISIPCIIGCFCILFLKKNYVLSILKSSFLKTREVRLIVYFFLFAFIGCIVNIITGHITFLRFLLSITVTYIFSFTIYYVMGLLLPFIFSKGKITKIFINALLIILTFGFFEFIMLIARVNIFEHLLSFFTGREYSIMLKMGLPRIQSFFSEPSIYAWFLSCIIPFGYSMFISKKRYFKNKTLNRITCKSLLPLILVSIILTQSPINLIFAALILLMCTFVFSRDIFKLLIKLILFALPFLLILLIFLSKANLSESYLYRIISTFDVINDFEALIIVEASLATRIISYVNMFIIYTHHPIFGTGCGSLITELYNQLNYSPLPLTAELEGVLQKSKATVANPAILFKIIVDTGSLGFICFYSFLLNIYRKVNNKLCFYNYDISDFLLGAKYTLLAFVLLSAYNSEISCHYFWCMFGLITGFTLRLKLLKSKE